VSLPIPSTRSRPIFFSPLVHCYLCVVHRRRLGATGYTSTACILVIVQVLYRVCARRVEESELGLGVGEDEDADGYAIKTIPRPIFDDEFQLRV
jgi:hypothetical protein